MDPLIAGTLVKCLVLRNIDTVLARLLHSADNIHVQAYLCQLALDVIVALLQIVVGLGQREMWLGRDVRVVATVGRTVIQVLHRRIPE